MPAGGRAPPAAPRLKWRVSRRSRRARRPRARRAARCECRLRVGGPVATFSTPPQPQRTLPRRAAAGTRSRCGTTGLQGGGGRTVTTEQIDIYLSIQGAAGARDKRTGASKKQRTEPHEARCSSAPAEAELEASKEMSAQSPGCSPAYLALKLASVISTWLGSRSQPAFPLPVCTHRRVRPARAASHRSKWGRGIKQERARGNTDARVNKSTNDGSTHASVRAPWADRARPKPTYLPRHARASGSGRHERAHDIPATNERQAARTRPQEAGGKGGRDPPLTR